MTTKLSQPDLLRTACYINGSWLKSNDQQTIPVTNPATHELIAHVPQMGSEETRLAIETAHHAQASWQEIPAEQRGHFLRRWAELLHQHQEDLAILMTLEQGKPLAESKGEILYSASFLEWFAEEAKRSYGKTIPSKSSDQRIITIKQPVGVCAAITPWNFPSAMITRKAGAALAAGCTMIVKPASQTPLSALALAFLAEKAGIPSGVFSVITGKASVIGNELTSHHLVRKFTFTGSTEIGSQLMRDCAPTIKRIALELGGNAPFLVFDDADVDAAVEGLMQSKFRNTGQTCVCANRVFVQDKVFDEFADRLKQRIENLVVGDGLKPEVTQGPLIDEKALHKVESLLEDAVMRGAKILTGGKRHSLGGTFYEPTLLVDVTTEMQIAQEEIFGPVAPLYRFTSDDEAIAMANDTPFGLAGYFYSRDIGRIWKIAEALECGMIGINTGLISNSAAPFGGIKQSGLGREGGQEGIEEYLETKYLCLAGLGK